MAFRKFSGPPPPPPTRCALVDLPFVHISSLMRSISHIPRMRAKCCATYCCIFLRLTLVSRCLPPWSSFRAAFPLCLVFFFPFRSFIFFHNIREPPRCWPPRISTVTICISGFHILRISMRCCVEFWSRSLRIFRCFRLGYCSVHISAFLCFSFDVFAPCFECDFYPNLSGHEFIFLLID